MGEPLKIGVGDQLIQFEDLEGTGQDEHRQFDLGVAMLDHIC
jgi:hypothetical protein